MAPATHLIQAGSVTNCEIINCDVAVPPGGGLIKARDEASGNRVVGSRIRQPEDDREVGDDSVVIGADPPRRVGNRSVFIGATDNAGNTRIAGGTAVGYNARADPTSVAIGAHALAGDGAIPHLLQLQVLLTQAGQTDAASAARDMVDELERNVPDKHRVRALWNVVKVGATGNEALAFIHEISHILGL